MRMEVIVANDKEGNTMENESESLYIYIIIYTPITTRQWSGSLNQSGFVPRYVRQASCSPHAGHISVVSTT